MASGQDIGNAAGGIFGSLFGGLLGNNQQDWLKNALMGVYNQQTQANSNGWQYALSQLNPASAAAQSLLGLTTQQLYGHDGVPGSATSLQDQLLSSMGGINQGQFQGSGITPQMQQMLDSMGGQAGGLQGAQGLLGNVLQNGGGSAQSNQIWQALSGMMGSGMNQQMSGTAQGLLSNPGSALTNSLQRIGQDSVLNGGMTNGLNNAQSALQYMVDHGGTNSNMDSGMAQALGMMNGQSQIGSQLQGAGMNGMASNLGVSGLTNTGAMGEQSALQGLQNQGQTQNSSFFQNRGQQLAGQDAVLPTMLAANFARDEATHQYKNAAEAARTQALAHGGGPGSLVANGTSNGALEDFADKGASGISNAVQQSMLNQQGLGLQQQQQGANMGLQGGQLALGNLNNSSQLLGGLENTATNRYGVGGGLLGQAGSLGNQQSQIGLGGVENLSGLQSQNVLGALGQMPGIANSAANQANTFGNLGLGAGQLQLGNQTLGGSLANMFNNTSLGANQGLQGSLNQANSYSLGAANGLNNMAGTSGGLYNNMFGNNLGAGQLGMNQTGNYYNALQGLFGQGNTMTGNQLGAYGTGLNSLLGIGTQGMNYANTGLGGMSHTFSGYNPQNALGQGVQNAAGGVGDLLKVFGL